jgi:hypothetical protein
MAITRQHITGFFLGMGAAAVGFFFYRQNQDKIDDFLRKRGIKLPGGAGKDYSSRSLEDLVREKERIEDIIAEREHELKNQSGETKKS